ncbi:MAG TPA: hypothetical protein VEA38_13545 [Terriglobales bacterium]|nr:hypothetical protein [Terriglobales bacterium]
MPLPLLALVGLGAAAAGAGGAGASGALGVGKADAPGNSFGDSKHYDPNKFHIGGDPQRSWQFGNRAGSQAHTYHGQQQALYGAGMADRDRALAMRGQQQDAIGLLQAQAHGRDLVANKIAEQQRNQMLAEQQSIAASARGPAGIALAHQNQAAAAAQGLAAIGQNQMIAGAQEQIAARNAYLQGLAAVRSQDHDASQQALGAGVAAGQLGLGNSQEERAWHEAQLRANMEQQRLLAGDHSRVDSWNNQLERDNAAKDMEWFKIGLGAMQGGTQGGGMMAMAGGKPA